MSGLSLAISPYQPNRLDSTGAISWPTDPVNFNGDSSGISQTVIRVCCSVPARLPSGSRLYSISQLKHRARELLYTGPEGVSQTLVRFTNEKDDQMQTLFKKNKPTRLKIRKVRNGKLDFGTGDKGHKQMEKARRKKDCKHPLVVTVSQPLISFEKGSIHQAPSGN